MELTINSQSTLKGTHSSLVTELKKMLTLSNPKYIEAVRFERSTHNIPAQLFFYHESNGEIIFPRGASGAVYHAARQFGKVTINDQRRILPEVDFSFTGKLRPYQKQTMHGVLEKDFGTLNAGTGAGKTVMALAIIASRKQPTLILVHTKELLYQWRNRIKAFIGVDAGLIGNGKFEIKQVSVAIVNTARKYLDTLPEHFGNIVVDECHRTPSTMFTETLIAFDSKYMLGLSATPYRRDGLNRLIGWYLGEHRVKVDMTELKATGAILEPEIIWKETDFRYLYEDDYQKMISALITDESRNMLIAADIRKQSFNGICLVVSDRVDHLNDLADRIGNINHEVLTGKTSSKKRQQIVQQVQAGEVSVLLSTLSLIGEGFDCSGLTNLFLCTPIKFSGRLKQVIGRVLRPADGKQPKIFDYVDGHVGLLQNTAKARKRVYDQAA